jgi:hypothetical protein
MPRKIMGLLQKNERARVPDQAHRDIAIRVRRPSPEKQ